MRIFLSLPIHLNFLNQIDLIIEKNKRNVIRMRLSPTCPVTNIPTKIPRLPIPFLFKMMNNLLHKQNISGPCRKIRTSFMIGRHPHHLQLGKQISTLMIGRHPHLQLGKQIFTKIWILLLDNIPHACVEIPHSL